MATTYARPAHKHHHYYYAAQRLANRANTLAGVHAAGAQHPRFTHMQARNIMAQATSLVAAAYAAGRGYTTAARAANYAYMVANELATETNAAASNA